MNSLAPCTDSDKFRPAEFTAVVLYEVELPTAVITEIDMLALEDMTAAAVYEVE